MSSITASICCLGPLLLLATGVNGAWMSRLMLLERYQPILITFTLVAFFLAARKMFPYAWKVDAADRCLEQKIDRKGTLLFVLSLIIALVFISSEYWVQFLA